MKCKHAKPDPDCEGWFNCMCNGELDETIGRWRDAKTEPPPPMSFVICEKFDDDEGEFFPCTAEWTGTEWRDDHGYKSKVKKWMPFPARSE